ncbi:unnamed protein product [Medioppia subpectinata]|uniref:Uncharacterized protein n=1 Tax=Medioppia subpectinata TaxID=1979941 RepID=A0A7R9KHF4_9ACAR|nr:unnamed protein product [Medioppia subpectinata]CAG2103430.1 unnamed protein product [Medioppia subpectinata]
MGILSSIVVYLSYGTHTVTDYYQESGREIALPSVTLCGKKPYFISDHYYWLLFGTQRQNSHSLTSDKLDIITVNLSQLSINSQFDALYSGKELTQWIQLVDLPVNGSPITATYNISLSLNENLFCFTYDFCYDIDNRNTITDNLYTNLNPMVTFDIQIPIPPELMVSIHEPDDQVFDIVKSGYEIVSLNSSTIVYYHKITHITSLPDFYPTQCLDKQDYAFKSQAECQVYCKHRLYTKQYGCLPKLLDNYLVAHDWPYLKRCPNSTRSVGFAPNSVRLVVMKSPDYVTEMVNGTSGYTIKVCLSNELNVRITETPVMLTIIVNGLGLNDSRVVYTLAKRSLYYLAWLILPPYLDSRVSFILRVIYFYAQAVVLYPFLFTMFTSASVNLAAKRSWNLFNKYNAQNCMDFTLE